jgi:8-oxo-dGTP pyrophosphatase MutT (NUDIX family)
VLLEVLWSSTSGGRRPGSEKLIGAVAGWEDAPMGLVRWRVSVKGVVLWDDSVVLLHNERGEWELPGGRLDDDETPEECIVREIDEELGFTVEVEQLLDTWVYEVQPGEKVLIVTFGCSAERPDELTVSDEHDDVGVFPVTGVADLIMPDGYRTSIRRWHAASKR